MKTKQEYIIELTNVIAIAKLQIEVIDKLLPVMKTLDGKDIRQQKRIKTKLAEVLPDFIVTFGEKYSWYEISVYATVNRCQQNIVSISCGYISETDTFDFDLITGIKERPSGGMLGNNYYFGTDTKYENVKQALVRYENQLKNVDKDYKTYEELHEKIKAFNVSFLSIEVRR